MDGPDTGASPGRVQVLLRMDPTLRARVLIDAGAHNRTSLTEHINALLDEHVPAYTEILTPTAGW